MKDVGPSARPGRAGSNQGVWGRAWECGEGPGSGSLHVAPVQETEQGTISRCLGNGGCYPVRGLEEPNNLV